MPVSSPSTLKKRLLFSSAYISALPLPRSISETAARLMFSLPAILSATLFISRTNLTFSAAERIVSKTLFLSQCPFERPVIHFGIQMFISFIGNAYSTCFKMLCISSSSRSTQLTGITGVSYFCESSPASCTASLDCGYTQFSSTTKGLFMEFSSFITRCSASSYSSRGISEILPSVVITSPIVE